jgi:amino acid transporter
LYTALFLALALAGSFRWNVTLSAIARLFAYSSTAIALIVLRRRSPSADAYRLPAGKLFAVLAMAFCAVLLVRAPLSNSWVVLVTVALATMNWFFAVSARKELA